MAGLGGPPASQAAEQPKLLSWRAVDKLIPGPGPPHGGLRGGQRRLSCRAASQRFRSRRWLTTLNAVPLPAG